MKLVEADCGQINLSGITLNGSVTLSNPHQILAVMFQLQARPHCFEIEPERGMILQSDKKFIKIRLKPSLRGEAERIEKQENILVIKATYYCQYNRKLLEKNSLKGWSTISKQYDENCISIRLSFEAEVQKLKGSLKRGDSLKHSRKQNSFEKFRDSSIKRVKDPKLNEDLDFLFRNQDYARQERSKRHQKGETRTKGHHEGQISHQLLLEPRMVESKEIREYQYNKGQLMEERKQSLQSNPARQSSKGRSIELVILAVIAALCLAAGQALGSIFKG